MENSSLNFNGFKNVSKSEWVEVATRQLKGELPGDSLEWSTQFGIPLQAYYDKNDREDVGYLNQFFSNVYKHDWRLYDHLQVDDYKKANEQALKALNAGCDGVLFSMSQMPDFEVLMNKVLFEHCEVSFCVAGELNSEIMSYRESNNVKGFVLAENMGWHSDAYAQSSGLDNLTEMVVDFAQSPTTEPVIYMELGYDFFHEMARVRAARYLFCRIAEVTGINLSPNKIWIHCEPTGSEDEFDNLFVGTTAGLAAIIGGANSLSFNPRNFDKRICRNIGNLIREEAKIGSFQNAATGSFFIDKLTDQIIRRVWSKLQEKLGA
ncbi:MAG: hypothetical protein GY816_03320 [Cytophagales bacterium]|nr:hypothetical protein [Cytophagales bacterium]